ncbi:hypothetical protein PR202_ga05854 [Eleusine coracana subsp. coracana]|uniref:Uncharacterized protein n=1 Tax=Eleusine coracana subsp. coracana TaxID=191504 RepID=A0AAV5BTX4_ELECO|nr:hypothetical protein PR202_ga05854 [Eleusine coracana subsp. coracana]
MRGGEMLTAARGAGAGTAPSTTTTSSAASAAAAAELARAGGVGGGNFPLAVALLAFAFANFINLVAIWCALPALLLPRRSKFLSAIVPTCRLKEKKWDARKFLSSAGVLSSLSATVGSLAVAVGHQEGVDSSAFALALVFAAVVMYDASGVRFHTGRQAALLNQIVCDFPPEHPIISTFRPLREPLGHSPLQVALSIILYSIHVYKVIMLGR